MADSILLQLIVWLLSESEFMSPQPIVLRKLADEVRDRLMAMIRRGELRPGDRLPSERDLTGIGHGLRSRIAVPDTRAMIDRMGQTVLHLLQTSPTTLDRLKEARILFEVGLVKMAAAHRPPNSSKRTGRATLPWSRSAATQCASY